MYTRVKGIAYELAEKKKKQALSAQQFSYLW